MHGRAIATVVFLCLESLAACHGGGGGGAPPVEEVSLAPVASFSTTQLDSFVPLTMYFDGSPSSSPDGPIVKYEWDFNGDGVFDLDSGSTPTIQFRYVVSGEFAVGLRITDSAGATAKVANPLIFRVSPNNQPPLASISADSTVGEAPLSIHFDAASSLDPEGALVRIEWDLDGDGNFEQSSQWDPFDPASFLNTKAQRTYGEVGDYSVALRVTDNAGFTQTASSTIHVYRWAQHSPNLGLQAGYFNSLMSLNDGHPAIGYLDGATGQVNFARATSPAPQSETDWQTHTVDAAVGPGLGFALVDGAPALAYASPGGAGLKFALARNAAPAGASDWDIVSVDASGDVCKFPSLVALGGKPAICYQAINSSSGAVLKFARALTQHPFLPSDWVFMTVDATAGSGNFAKLASVNGNPAICYWQQSQASMYYAQSEIAEPNSASDWSVHQVGYYSPESYNYPSLVEWNGRAAIAYYDAAFVQPKLSFANTANPQNAADWSTFTLQSSVLGGSYSSLAVVDGKLALAFFGVRNPFYTGSSFQDLQSGIQYALAQNSSPQGPGDFSIKTLDGAAGFWNGECSLAVIRGTPAVSYFGSGAFVLKFTQAVVF